MNRFFFCRLAVQQQPSNKHFGDFVAPCPNIKADDITASLHCRQLNEAISCFSISVCFCVLNVTACLQICFPQCVLSMYSTTYNNGQEEWQLSPPHKQMYVITCNISWKLNSSSLVGCEHSAALQQQTAESAWSLARGKNTLPFKLMGGRMQILSFHNLMRRKKWPVGVGGGLLIRHICCVQVRPAASQVTGSGLTSQRQLTQGERQNRQSGRQHGKGNYICSTHSVELIGDFHQLLMHLHPDVFAL